MDLIVGTAGHIDHGKTALVKALTGVDADRLPEEKQRGITIDLGFAEMQAGDISFGFVDVPGHERFVKNMLAGASGIDLVMLVIAADEGVMPQTREHFDICRLLKIKSGVIVLTKTDLADSDTMELARLDALELVAGSFLENAPVFAVSSRTGEGVQALKDGLIHAAENMHREREIYATRLSIDRSFSVKGFGAVVTGTLAAGEIAEGDELELMPAAKRLRVRGVQTHGKTVSAAHGGQRTAVNLAAIDHDKIVRGMLLTRPGSIAETLVFDAEVEVLKDSPLALRSRQRVRVHLGTAEILARVSVLNDGQSIDPGANGYAQFRLEAPVPTAHGDRFIIRSYSPQQTIAGGRVLDPVARRHRRNEIAGVVEAMSELSNAADGDGNIVEILVRMAGDNGIKIDDLRARTALRSDALKDLVEKAKTESKIVEAAGVLVARSVFDSLKTSTIAAIERHHRSDKLSRGLSRETLREQIFKRTGPELFRAVTEDLERSGKIVVDQDVFKLAAHTTELSPAETLMHDRLGEIYSSAGLEVPKLDEALQDAAAISRLDAKSARKVFQLFVNRGELVAVTGEYYFTAEALVQLVAKLRESAKESGDATLDVARFKQIAGVSRKYAIPLLEYLDRTRVTRRVGDKRQIL